MRCVALFLIPTQLYVELVYTMPYACSAYSEWTLYCVCVLCWFMKINAAANWLAVILYDPSYQKTKDNPYIDVNHRTEKPPDQFQPWIQQAIHDHKNGSVVYDMAGEEDIPWVFCKYCSMNVPPRTYHCKICQKCIPKRDHHCFMVGNCVGFRNQRYFIMFCFYVLVNEVSDFYFTYKYMRDVYWPESAGFKEFILPVAIYRWLFGVMEGHYCLMVVHLTTELIFSVMGFIYFTSQMKLTKEGITLLEVAKKVPIRNTNSFQRNMRSIFGDFWALNFFFPMTPIFRQMDDGVHWEGVKYDQNANKKWEDDGQPM